jgi:hypothetical protein
MRALPVTLAAWVLLTGFFAHGQESERAESLAPPADLERETETDPPDAPRSPGT